MIPPQRSFRTRPRGDDGASLIIVMAFVICVGLVLTAVLSYAGTGIRSAAATESRQALSADAAGAMDVAINTLRNSDYADPNDPCPSPFDYATAPTTPETRAMKVPGGQGEVWITCVPEDGSGVEAGVVPINALNRPGSAVLTLGTSTSETGFAKGSNGILRIKGRVYVNSNITVGGTACPSTNCSEINVVEAPVIAKTGCPVSQVFSTVSVTCNFTGNPPEGKDPNSLTDADMANGTAIGNGYDQPPSGFTELIPRFVTSSCPGHTATLEPGYYTDAVALSEKIKKCQKWVHFKPGIYYFDFRNEEVQAWKTAWEAANGPVTAPLGIEPGPNELRVHNTKDHFYLIAGTKKDWSGDVPINFPGSCVSPLNDTQAGKGVQFIFGGNSRMNVTYGRAELCGQYHTDKPALVVYGAKTGSTVVEPLRASTASMATSPTDAAHTTFTTPGEGQLQGGGLATASIVRSATANTIASMRLAGTDVAIPPGSLLTKAELRVTHQELTSIATDTVAVAVMPNATTSSIGGTVPVPLSGTMTTHTLDVTDKLLGEVYRNGLSNMKLDYLVQAVPADVTSTSMTADLDGLRLWLEWQPPSLRGENEPIAGAPNCVVTGTTCPVVKAGSNNVLLYLQGTTYVPLGHVNISLTNVTAQVFKAGIVARSLDISITPSTGYSGPVIEVPGETGAGVNMDVYLTAYSCRIASCASSAAPPSADWRRIGRSTVSLESTYPVPTNGSRAVTVKSWNVLG